MTVTLTEFSLRDRVALVTHETAPQGKAIADALAEAGARVLVLGDVQDNSTLTPKELVRRAVAPVGRLDLLVTTHIIPPSAPAEFIPVSRFRQEIETNLGAVFFWCQAAAARMQSQTPAGGCIINISSVGGVVGMPGQSAFCAAMAGVDAMTQTLATEWKPYAIRVVAVGAGLSRELADKGTLKTILPDGVTPGHYRIPERTRTTEDDVARLVAFLASHAGRHLNGTTVYTDAGWLADGYWE